MNISKDSITNFERKKTNWSNVEPQGEKSFFDEYL